MPDPTKPDLTQQANEPVVTPPATTEIPKTKSDWEKLAKENPVVTFNHAIYFLPNSNHLSPDWRVSGTDTEFRWSDNMLISHLFLIALYRLRFHDYGVIEWLKHP